MHVPAQVTVPGRIEHEQPEPVVVRRLRRTAVMVVMLLVAYNLSQ